MKTVKNFLKFILPVLFLNFMFINVSLADTLVLGKILGLDSKFYQSNEQIQQKLSDLDKSLNLTEEQNKTASQFAEVCKGRLIKYRLYNSQNMKEYLDLKADNKPTATLQEQMKKIKSNQIKALNIRNNNIAAFKTMLTNDQNSVLDDFVKNMESYSNYTNLLQR